MSKTADIVATTTVDIVTRLRTLAPWWEVCAEGADEIERLRAIVTAQRLAIAAATRTLAAVDNDWPQR